MALLYLLCIVGGFVLLVFRGEIAASGSQDSPEDFWLLGLILVGMGIPLSIAYITAFFLPVRPWVWVYHLVLIAIGLTSACCWAASIPLLIFWIKPETQAYFGRSKAASGSSPNPPPIPPPSPFR
jgi:hypothetical protein